VIDIIKNRKGKIMIYHNYVIMSGVLFIREILLHNGIIDEHMNSAPNTLCVLCGIPRQSHDNKHEFKPVRFTMLHGDIDKHTIDDSMSKFNDVSNSMGNDIMILLGSKMIKESYDLKAVCHLMVTSRPDNISTLIQIMGRAVRNNSHRLLPVGMRNVNVYIFVSSIKSGKLSHEEEKYRIKMEEYGIIQDIEKLLHENAVDSQ
jgi:superfamily II DNA/RNA helicase